MSNLIWRCECLIACSVHVYVSFLLHWTAIPVWLHFHIVHLCFSYLSTFKILFICLCVYFANTLAWLSVLLSLPYILPHILSPAQWLHWSEKWHDAGIKREGMRQERINLIKINLRTIKRKATCREPVGRGWRAEDRRLRDWERGERLCACEGD